MDIDPLERIAVALVDEIRSRRSMAPPSVPTPESSPEATAAVVTAAPAAGARGKRERRIKMYPDHFNLRIRAEDRDRFDAYAYRHRLMKGEVFQRMMDALEALEQEQKGGGSSPGPSAALHEPQA